MHRMEAASSKCSLKNTSAVFREPSVDREFDSVLFIVQVACEDLQEDLSKVLSDKGF